MVPPVMLSGDAIKNRNLSAPAPVVLSQVPQLVNPQRLGKELRWVNMRNRRLLGGAMAAAPASSWAVAGGYQHAALLLDWARAICAYHAVPVHDFATSFADGRVVCLLVGFLLRRLSSWSFPNAAECRFHMNHRWTCLIAEHGANGS